MTSHSIIDADTMPDAETCRRARLSRDCRFDGEFFLAVRTTGIYCRPVCPARQPAEKNVEYYREACQAAAAGFRPCLRCRPEAAPGSPAWQGSTTTVNRALALIQAGALNQSNLVDLADRLGVGERYLRKLFQRELGVSPLAVAQNRRLLFAKQLLVETGLSMTDIAFAAGFGSVRRFNSAIRDSFGVPPTGLRRANPRSASSITLQLQYRPPYDWAGVVDFFARHAIEGVESVSASTYQRRFNCGGQAGLMTVTPASGKNALSLTLELPRLEQLMPTVARIRRMFDLDANPEAIAGILGRDAGLSRLLEAFPGIRSPVNWSPQEATVRAIVGQQVSIGAARTVCARLADACGGAGLGFPEPAAIAQLDDCHFAMPTRRRDSLRHACRMLAQQMPDDLLTELGALPGIGPWTLAMVAMRGLGDPDTFPVKDLGLMKAWNSLPGAEEPLDAAAGQWRPFRAYAANLLWRSL